VARHHEVMDLRSVLRRRDEANPGVRGHRKSNIDAVASEAAKKSDKMRRGRSSVSNAPSRSGSLRYKKPTSDSSPDATSPQQGPHRSSIIKPAGKRLESVQSLSKSDSNANVSANTSAAN